MREFDKIFLCWRQGQGSRRHVVGVLQKIEDVRYEFSYFPKEVESALENGFTPYTEFPDIKSIYNGNVLDVFSQRLTKSDRPDVQKFYDFWEIEDRFKNDKFYLLGHTQGLLPTDNFEFLADYNPVDGVHFLTDLAALSKLRLEPSLIKEGDRLRFEIEKDNDFDPEAVKVFNDNLEVGYIKKIHCRIFHKLGAERLNLTVKAIEKNGIIKRVFIKVFK